MDRAQYLARLEAEAVLAEGYGDTVRAAELRAQIKRASAGSAQPPAKETAAMPPATETTTAAARPARRNSGTR